VTGNISERLVRLPLWLGLEDHMDTVLEAADEALATA
jgi:dTDP-4-amino-4,6-dideoxygalactose transaminase